MATLDIRMPDLSKVNGTDKKLQLVLDAVQQMSRQVQHALNHLGEESLSAELTETINGLKTSTEAASKAVDKQTFSNAVRKLEQRLNDKADAVYNDGETAFDLWTLLLALLGGSMAVQLLKNSGVTVDASGVTMADGSAFSSAGAVAAKSGAFSSKLTLDGDSVLTAGNIHIGSTEPANPTAGMIWIQPTGSSDAWDTCTVQYYRGVIA